MCGIAGEFSFGRSRIDTAIVGAMVSALDHRGPNDDGCVAFAGTSGGAAEWRPSCVAPPSGSHALAFGNRRLSIVDLSPLGHQPMSTPDGRYWIAYNGEVYNHIELRTELEALGCSFRGGSDTEVVLAAYAHWGRACFARFNGMWAIAIYDTQAGEFVLSRDRFGVKPLYIHTSDQGLVFASEIKALLRHPRISREPNLSTVYNYAARHYRCVDGGSATFFKDISALPPGECWTFTGSGVVAQERYWSLDPTVRVEMSDEEAIIRFREIFSSAVALRLRADVPLAVFLSGGLDSTSVACMAAAQLDRPLVTVSARFDEAGFDEGEYIEATVAMIGAEEHFVYPRSTDLLGTLERMLAYHDEPVCTATWLSHWLLMEEMADAGYPVVLNGHVGDELFGGYWDHHMYNLMDLERAGGGGFDEEFASWKAVHDRDPAEFDRAVARVTAIERGKATEWTSLTGYDAAVTSAVRSEAFVPKRPNPFGDSGVLSRRLHQELFYETVPATLKPEDRNSMAFSIESRSPFLDYRLVEFAFALPNRFKVRGGLGKWMLREGMRGLLPETVRTRTDKQGMITPTETWFRSDAGLAVREILASQSLRDRGFLDQDVVLRLFDEHQSGSANHYMAIWQWLNLELWMRQVYD